MQLAQRVGLVEDHLGDERPGLDVAAALELEDVALGAEHHSVSETLLQGPVRRTRHLVFPCSKRAGSKRAMS